MSRSELSDKQAEFARQYVIDLNGTRAAIAAGYSEKSASRMAHDLLKNPPVELEIRRLLEDKAARNRISADKVLREIARIAFSDIRSVVSFSDSGTYIFDSDTISDDAAAAISEIKQTCTKDGRNITVKLHSKSAALDQLMKHLGLYEPDELRKLREEWEEFKRMSQE